MTTAIKRRRGTTTQHSAFTGLEGEITVDTTKDTLVVHDGSTAGGFPLLREDLSNNTNVITTTNTKTLTNKTLTSPIINGTGVTFNDGSSQASAQVGMKNRLIDAGFIINQRGYVSGTALAAGAYAHDRWKAGSGGCTYTFTQGSLGVPITITITAGSLLQIIEGCNMPEGGTYTVSWTGTAQARVNGGSYSSSPLVVTGLTAGANCTVEFNTGTLSKPSVEVGSTATSFDYRPYGTELELCQRYLPAFGRLNASGWVTSATNAYIEVPFPVSTRVNPTGVTLGAAASSYNVYSTNASGLTATAVAFNAGYSQGARLQVTVASGLTQGAATAFNTSANIYFTGCEL